MLHTGVARESCTASHQTAAAALQGWCVRTNAAIPQGRFVCEYAGEYVSGSEAEQRLAEYDKQERGHALLVSGGCLHIATFINTRGAKCTTYYAICCMASANAVGLLHPVALVEADRVSEFVSICQYHSQEANELLQ